jgi:hypothetical protein
VRGFGLHWKGGEIWELGENTKKYKTNSLRIVCNSLAICLLGKNQPTSNLADFDDFGRSVCSVVFGL